MHHALGLLRPGDILLVDRLGDTRHACWGGGVTVAAKASGAKAGLVDGPCTDMEEIEASDFPMWCRGMAPITTRIYDLGGRLNRPVSIGEGRQAGRHQRCLGQGDGSTRMRQVLWAAALAVLPGLAHADPARVMAYKNGITHQLPASQPSQILGRPLSRSRLTKSGPGPGRVVADR